MKILPYKLDTTNDLLTSRGGLLVLAKLLQQLHLAQCIDTHFPLPGSNRGLAPSVFITTMILMHHDGHFCLDSVRHLHQDNALRTLLNLNDIPQATTMGDWLRRMGNIDGIDKAWQGINQHILQTSLSQCKQVTLDIDATQIVCDKANAKWSYQKKKGFMPMVGHIAQTGQILAVDFRHGNVSEAKDNLAFIQHCQQALPSDCHINALRIDAAGYQQRIIRYCDLNNIAFAIRAKRCAALQTKIDEIPADDWQPFIGKDGKVVDAVHTCRMRHHMGDYDNPFSLIIQRTTIKGQMSINLEEDNDGDTVTNNGYVYRMIATNRDDLNNSQIIHWYNQRGEDSENRIKEFKRDFGADKLPCTDFAANQLYLLIVALSYNLFALLRKLLPKSMRKQRAITIRWRLYAMAAKVVKSGRQYVVKLQEDNRKQLAQVLMRIQDMHPPPI